MKIRLKVYHPGFNPPRYPGDVVEVEDSDFVRGLLHHRNAELVEPPAAQTPAPPEPLYEADASRPDETPDHVSA